MLSASTIDILHRSYDKRDYSDEEFNEDVSRVYSIMRMIRKYIKHGETSPRAIINNIVILYNVFGNMATYALDEEADEKCSLYVNTCLHMMGRRKSEFIDEVFLEYIERALK
jgi:maltooligosyltrehalose synthase